MDTTKFTMGIVGLVVIILMVTGAVLPVIEDAQTHQRTMENNASPRYIATMASEEIVFAVDSDSIPTINGVKISSIVTMPAEGVHHVWAVSDNWMMRTYISANSWSPQWDLFYETDLGAGTAMTIDDEALVCSNGIAKVMDGDDATLELSYDYLMLPSEKGDYVEYTREVSAVYVDSGKTIYIASTSNNTTWVLGHGTIDNIVVDKNFSSGVSTAGTITAVYTVTEDGGSNKLSYFTSTGSSLTSSTGVFVPLKYSVITENDAQIISLLGIIPLLLIIVAVLYAVRLMGASRN